MAPTHSYDAGEEIRVTRDGSLRLHVHHGAHELATMRPVLGGEVRIDAGGRTWRLTQHDGGWTAQGDPPAALATTFLGGRRLTVGNQELAVRGKKVKGLLRFTKDSNGAKPCLRGEIVKPPPPGTDPHALVVLATAAVCLGVNLDEPPPHVPAQQTPGVTLGH